MRNIKTFALPALLSLGMLTGCAGTPTAYQYQDKSSYALNVANAAGVTGVQDAKAPEGLDPEHLKMLEDGANLAEMMGDGFDAAFMAGAAANLISMPGIGSGGALAFGILDLLNTPIGPGPAEVNSVAAWMPASMAATPKEAHEKMKQVFTDAIVAAAAQKGFELIPDESGVNNPDHIGFWMIDESRGCTKEYVHSHEWKGNACIVAAFIYEPILVPTPKLVSHHAEEQSYGSTYTLRTKGRLIPLVRVYAPKQAMLQEDLFLATISENLPAWANLLLGSKVTNTKGGEPIPFPYVLNQGRAHLYLKTQ